MSRAMKVVLTDVRSHVSRVDRCQEPTLEEFDMPATCSTSRAGVLHQPALQPASMLSQLGQPQSLCGGARPQASAYVMATSAL
jgi:hypothetical protein